MAFTYQAERSLAVTSAGEQLLDTNPSRHLLKLVNTGANPADISLSGNPASGAGSFPLAAGAAWEPQNVPANAVWAHATAGTTILFTQG